SQLRLLRGSSRRRAVKPAITKTRAENTSHKSYAIGAGTKSPTVMERVRALARGRGIEIAADDYGLTHSREIIAQRTAVWTRTTCPPCHKLRAAVRTAFYHLATACPLP